MTEKEETFLLENPSSVIYSRESPIRGRRGTSKGGKQTRAIILICFLLADPRLNNCCYELFPFRLINFISNQGYESFNFIDKEGAGKVRRIESNSVGKSISG